MAKLIIDDPSAAGDASIGGQLLAPVATDWPTCNSCSGHMQFLAQLPLAESGVPEFQSRAQWLLLFQCQNSPGLCDEWDPESGGNAARLVAAGERVVLAAPPGPTLLPSESKLFFRNYDDSCSTETPDDAYCEAVDAPGSAVLGKLGGHPLWLQADETPTCSCGQHMVFVAQLEERGGGGINFGGAGAGYAFVCKECAEAAKFLWQC